MSEVGSASGADLSAIQALLASSGLPTSDLASAQPEFVVIWERRQIVAAGALQRFGSTALLRSVVVRPERRRGGLGRQVVVELEQRARSTGVDHLILLTETAVEFFVRLGYRVIERRDAPQDTQQSEEFRSLCPSSATCMAKRLTDQ